MGLRYATVTGVACDDLPDEGAWLYAETIRAIHARSPGTPVEILIPDFLRQPQLSAAGQSADEHEAYAAALEVRDGELGQFACSGPGFSPGVLARSEA